MLERTKLDLSKLPAQTERTMFAKYGEQTLRDVTDTRIRLSCSNDIEHPTIIQGGPMTPQQEKLWRAKLLKA